jgi:hypothetical protein
LVHLNQATLGQAEASHFRLTHKGEHNANDTVHYTERTMALEWSTEGNNSGVTVTTSNGPAPIAGSTRTNPTPTRNVQTATVTTVAAPQNDIAPPRNMFVRYYSSATAPSSTATLLQRSLDEPTRSRLRFADEGGKSLAVVEFSDNLHYSPSKPPEEPTKCSAGSCCTIA